MRRLETTAGRKTGRHRGYIARYQPQAKTRALLEKVELVLNEYREYWPLTCRQIFYRLVGAHAYPKNEGDYGRLCHHLANARRACRIPFGAIRDDGVTTWRLDHFDDHEAFLRHLRILGQNYTRNKLAGQEVHLEVWCEAAGMLPQLYAVASTFSVPVYSSGGFDSLTAKKNMADRICRIGKPTVVLHLGDRDPSGESIFDAVAEDVTAFVMADRPWATISVDFERIALTDAQVQEFDLPTSPAKASDSRSKGWKGGTCQLEALPPNTIANILHDAIVAHLDEELLDLDHELEEQERQRIALSLPAPSSGGAA